MGTVSCSNWQTKKDVVNELTNDLKRSGFNVLGEKGTADGVWYLVEKNQEKFIYFGKITKSQGQFFLKTMDESYGPCYYTCPLKFIENAGPAKSEYAKQWREKVIAYQSKSENKKKLKAGMKINLYGQTYTMVTEYVLGRGSRWIVKDENGKTYSLKRTQIRELEIIGE